MAAAGVTSTSSACGRGQGRAGLVSLGHTAHTVSLGNWGYPSGSDPEQAADPKGEAGRESQQETHPQRPECLLPAPGSIPASRSDHQKICSFRVHLPFLAFPHSQGTAELFMLIIHRRLLPSVYGSWLQQRQDLPHTLP